VERENEILYPSGLTTKGCPRKKRIREEREIRKQAKALYMEGLLWFACFKCKSTKKAHY